MPVCVGGSSLQVTGHPSQPVCLPHSPAEGNYRHCMADMLRVRNGIKIRRAKKKRNLQNDTRIRASVAGHDAGSYTRMQFLRAINHSLGAHTDAFDIAVEITDDECDDEQQQQQPDQATTAVTSDNTTVTSAQSVGDTCVVCLMAPRDGVALVPCGHSRFCGACAATVATMDNGCPVCRHASTW